MWFFTLHLFKKRSLIFSSATTIMHNLYFLTFITPRNNHSIFLKLLKKPFILWQTQRMKNTNINNKNPPKNLQPSRNKHLAKNEWSSWISTFIFLILICVLSRAWGHDNVKKLLNYAILNPALKWGWKTQILLKISSHIFPHCLYRQINNICFFAMVQSFPWCLATDTKAWVEMP